MQIAVYAICKNEAPFASRFMASCVEADVVVIADTGSVDGSPALLRGLGASVFDVTISPWRFDDARNAALALVPATIDVCVSLDMDEVIQPGWRVALEEAWTAEATRARFTTVYSRNADGTPGIVFTNDRIHSRRGYRWRHACHEGLYPDRIDETFVHAADLRVDHFPDPSKDRSNYLELLERAVSEEPHEPRMAHYLAREYFFEGRHRDAIAEFERHLSFADNHFADERGASMIYIAKCLDVLGEDGAPWYHRAIAESPSRREPWINLAETLYRRSDWPGCYAAAVRGLSIAPGDSGYMSDPHCYGATPDDLASIAAWHIGLRDVALTHARAALAFAPDDQRLKANVELMEHELADLSSANTAV